LPRGNLHGSPLYTTHGALRPPHPLSAAGPPFVPGPLTDLREYFSTDRALRRIRIPPITFRPGVAASRPLRCPDKSPLRAGLCPAVYPICSFGPSHSRMAAVVPMRPETSGPVGLLQPTATDQRGLHRSIATLSTKTAPSPPPPNPCIIPRAPPRSETVSFPSECVHSAAQPPARAHKPLPSPSPSHIRAHSARPRTLPTVPLCVKRHNVIPEANAFSFTLHRILQSETIFCPVRILTPPPPVCCEFWSAHCFSVSRLAIALSRRLALCRPVS